ncbi:MAG: DUF1566 domain-containing protein [Magnetococcales bacterium]|nr:DUF1566 domain-containing protein [Magnetococcales bacterium]
MKRIERSMGWVGWCLVLSMWLPIRDLCAADAPAPVRQTGQTTSFSTGDDGNVRKGAIWPTPRFVVNGDGTTTDELTGLIWMQNASCWYTQTWANALTKVAGLNGTTESCSGYSGRHTDWRLPSVHELQSLVDAGRLTPALPTGHPFSGFRVDNWEWWSGYYWSNTTCAGNTDNAWTVDLREGYVGNGGKTSSNYVLPVRGGQ